MSEMQTFTTKIENFPDLPVRYIFDIFVGDTSIEVDEISVPIKQMQNTDGMGKSFDIAEYSNVLKIKKTDATENFFDNNLGPHDLTIKLRKVRSTEHLPVYWNFYNVTRSSENNNDYLIFNYHNFELIVNEEKND